MLMATTNGIATETSNWKIRATMANAVNPGLQLSPRQPKQKKSNASAESKSAQRQTMSASPIPIRPAMIHPRPDAKQRMPSGNVRCPSV